MKHSVPGSDKETLRCLRSIAAADLAIQFIVILLMFLVASPWRRSKATLIAKTSSPSNAAEYRPLIVGQMRKRLFYRILAKQVRSRVTLVGSQRGFSSVDNFGIRRDVA